MNVTIFRNIKDTDTPFYRDVYKILDRIRDGKSKDIVKRIREEKDKEKRNLMKQELPAICFSGEFTKREDKALVKHSGLICLDFDNFVSRSEMIAMRDDLVKDKYVFSVFISPSGNGLKVLVKIPEEQDKHKQYFEALEKHFNSPYFDKTSKNISRVCYESFDPIIHVNEDSAIWDKVTEEDHEHMHVRYSDPTIKLSNQSEIIRRLTNWWDKNYGIVEGERNNNIYILAAAFNDFGVEPTTAEYVLRQYAHDGFGEDEILITFKSAYNKKANFGTKFFEDKDKVYDLKRRLKEGASKKEIRSHLEEAGVEDADVDAVIEALENDKLDTDFWSKSDKGVVSLVHHLFKKFLEDHGYRKYSPEGTQNYIFVRVVNSLISNTNEEEIKDFVLDYLMDRGDMSVYNFFADKTRYFKDDFLTLLSPVDVHFMQDTKDTSYLYFRNCAVQVKGDDVRVIDYIDLNGFVWKDQVIDRDFIDCDMIDCDFKKFISNVSGSEENRIKSVESTIGYLMHGHKNMAYCPAIIINDEVITDNPEGGTGKGIFVNAIGKLKKMVTIDGKSFNFERTFAYQLVSADTQILTFDDVRKRFDFERLFSIVTEGITLEKKNKDAIKIPFHKSPKIVITTNYAIKGAGNSFARRKWELEFKKFYSKDYTPYNEFGRMLFDDWDEDEWCRFDNYMIQCLQLYLNKGLLESDFVNLKERKFHAETCKEFADWCADEKGNKLVFGKPLHANELFMHFTTDYPDFAARSKYTISRRLFTQWLRTFNLHETGQEPVMSRDRSGQLITFMKIDTPLPEPKKDDEWSIQEEIPF